MEIGDLVIYDGRPCYLRGVQPMGVADRYADVEDATTGERLTVRLAELSAAPEGGAGALEPPAA